MSDRLSDLYCRLARERMTEILRGYSPGHPTHVLPKPAPVRTTGSSDNQGDSSGLPVVQFNQERV